MISSNIFHPGRKKKLEQVLISFQLSIHNTTSKFQLFNNCVNFQSLSNFFPNFSLISYFLFLKFSSIKVICKVRKRKGENLMFVENTGCGQKHRAKSDKGKQMRQNLEMHQFHRIFEFCHIFFFFFLCAPFDTREDYIK
jgi:hypothetical protein